MEAGSTIKILSADIQGFLAEYKPQQAVVINEPSPKVRKLCRRTKNRETTKKRSFCNDLVGKKH